MIDRTYRRTIRTLLLMVMFAATAAACGDKDGGKGGGSIDESVAPEIFADPLQLVFAESALSRTESLTATITNIGEGPLNITNIRMVEETRDDIGGEEFARGADWVTSALLAQNESLQLTVDYTPRDESPDHGFIELTTNDPDYPDGFRIELQGPELAPRIFASRAVTFQRVPPVTEQTRDTATSLLAVQNVGQSPLQLDNIVVSPTNSDFHIRFAHDMELGPEHDSDDFPTVLQPDETFGVRVFFNPVDDLPSTAQLVFFSNDPENPEFDVSLIGNSGAPCLQLNHEDTVSFGEGGIGFENNKTIVIENCSPSSSLEVSEISVCTDVGSDCTASPIFEINQDSLPEGLPGESAIIPALGRASFVLTFTPESLDQSTGVLTVKSDDPAKSTLQVPVVGKGTDNACPTAIAEAKLTDNTRWETIIDTIPLKTVEFRGTNSIDTDGTIERYEWQIIDKPPNSSARFTPSAEVGEPSLFLDLAGTYLVELRVFDDKGTENCGEQAFITIRATPDEDIHIQLVWDTPGDPDQTDELGTDLDLHFLHPNGQWNMLPYDIFWRNTEADWGPQGSVGDPSLDIDDTDGLGPENINLDDPESGLTYAVGVYYFQDNGFGPSYATVRIYIRGERQFEMRNVFMAGQNTFWYVATIDWPSTQIIAKNQVQDGFPTRP